MNKALLLILLLTHLGVYAQVYETNVEKFQNNTRGWYLADTKFYKAQILGEKYILDNNTENTKEFLSSFVIDPTYDYTIDVQFMQTSKEKGAYYGFVWGNYLDSDDITFLINKKNFSIRGKVDNKSILIKNWKRKGKINKLGTPNLLTIKKRGKIIKYFVNGKRVYTSDNYPLVGTELGFVLYGETSIEVDFVKVSALKKQMYLIDNPINNFELQNLGEKVNSEHSERGPVISSDGKTLYITRTHPDNINGVNTDDIWYTQIDESEEWCKLIHAQKPLNNEGNNFVIGSRFSK